MNEPFDELFADEPQKWIENLPAIQRDAINQMLEKGASYEDAALEWVSAAASTTAPFSAGRPPVVDKQRFLSNLKAEVRAFICGDKKYKKERDGLFGEKGIGRTYVISGIAVAIAPHLGVAAPVISPVVALSLATLGNIAINAWCASTA